MTNDEYKAKCQWLSEFYAEAARTGNHMLLEGVKTRASPTLESDFSNWRLKPEPQKAWVVWDGGIPLSVCRSESLAEAVAVQVNGTIQEITRPD